MQRYKEKNQRKEEEMYRVVTMYGTDEPWWFFDGWKEDIVSVDEFDDFYKALKYYKKEWFEMAENFKEFFPEDGDLSLEEVLLQQVLQIFHRFSVIWRM